MQVWYILMQIRDGVIVICNGNSNILYVIDNMFDADTPNSRVELTTRNIYFHT